MKANTNHPRERLAGALIVARTDLADLVGALHLAADGAGARGDRDLKSTLRLLARHGERVVERVEQLEAGLADRDELCGCGRPSLLDAWCGDLDCRFYDAGGLDPNRETLEALGVRT